MVNLSELTGKRFATEACKTSVRKSYPYDVAQMKCDIIDLAEKFDYFQSFVKEMMEQQLRSQIAVLQYLR